MNRHRTLTVRMSEDEARMTHAIAEHEGVSISDVVRLFIRQRYGEIRGGRGRPVEVEPRETNRLSNKRR